MQEGDFPLQIAHRTFLILGNLSNKPVKLRIFRSEGQQQGNPPDHYSYKHQRKRQQCPFGTTEFRRFCPAVIEITTKYYYNDFHS